MNDSKIEELAEKLYRSIRYTPYTLTKEQLDAIEEYENFQGKSGKMSDSKVEELLQVLKKLRKQYDDYQPLDTTMVEVDALLERYDEAGIEKVEDPVRVAIEQTSQEWAKALTSLIDFLGGDGPSLWNWSGETPTPEKIVAYLKEHVKYLEELAADGELSACCNYLETNGEYIYRDGLRRLRRPQPTLKSQALKDLETVRKNSDVLPEILDTIEKALKGIPEDSGV